MSADHGTTDRRQALCCVCGELRTFSARYRGGGRIDEPKLTEWGDERCTITLVCAVCGQPTRHAFIRGDAGADRIEPVNKARRLLQYLATRWPDWQVRFNRDLPTGVREVFDPDERIIWLDPSPTRLEHRIGHAVAHLVMHLHGRVQYGRDHRFTEAEEQEADLVADIWLRQVAQQEIARTERNDQR